jgi:hypothetical protein
VQVKKRRVVARYTDVRICVFKRKDKRDVTMTSSELGCELIEVPSTRGVKQKPEAVAKYNNFMRGVDHCDQLLSYYSCERKSLRWYKMLAIHLFQMMVTNSFI